MIKVLKAGFYSTIQDLGRFGQRAYGVPVSGAMDAYSNEFANELLGNDKTNAVLEMTMSGAELQFLIPTTIAVTGANMNPKLNTKPIPMFKSVILRSNDILSFGNLESGFRTYLSVKSGFLTETILGSRSMTNNITETARIQKDDILQISNASDAVRPKHAKLKFNASYFEDYVLEVTKGPEFCKLSYAQQESLLNQEYKVSKFNNRMAYQLLPLFHNDLDSILTAPVLPGTVQLTPSGQLIVLMRDCQTTGGYPRILQLTEQSINTLSQKFTENSLKFRLKN
ncbi:5-oxoprolinase subunit C family protein [Winogradskyella bathintestinalis]|uniref:Biotin-dependent carboxyltransferase family protein n=1 Tax=Winogradskyella bathintestinalis TaxID=3035208 RepID=A0ABT7ZW77_9FLAO|nr:biotin-dependent carboxyltransferase family protein [Winogradskyella bathintestinalis]MDN3492983.1 biotin-dependent carboxyltransferase family protein [Winogradskyella bathintestinalis]